jgi:DnaJ-class molecular chaperone
MSVPSSYYVGVPEGGNGSLSEDDDVTYVICNRCKGSGTDPTSRKSYQDDEWDCTECQGYGDIPYRN